MDRQWQSRDSKSIILDHINYTILYCEDKLPNHCTKSERSKVTIPLNYFSHLSLSNQTFLFTYTILFIDSQFHNSARTDPQKT